MDDDKNELEHLRKLVKQATFEAQSLKQKIQDVCGYCTLLERDPQTKKDELSIISTVQEFLK